MKYMGSKNRIAKFVLPIMIKEYFEEVKSGWYHRYSR